MFSCLRFQADFQAFYCWDRHTLRLCNLSFWEHAHRRRRHSAQPARLQKVNCHIFFSFRSYCVRTCTCSMFSGRRSRASGNMCTACFVLKSIHTNTPSLSKVINEMLLIVKYCFGSLHKSDIFLFSSDVYSTSFLPVRPLPECQEVTPTIEVDEFLPSQGESSHPFAVYKHHLYVYPKNLKYDSQKVYAKVRPLNELFHVKWCHILLSW